MHVKDAIRTEMQRYLKACEERRMGDAHRHLAAYKRLCHNVVTVHESLKMMAGV